MAKLFSDIISFKQKEGESLHAAWTRFKKMLRMCPQHNLSQRQQTQTFYNGADQSVRSMLDAAANGCLFRKTPAEAWEIIGNMAESNIGWPDVKKEKKAGILEVDALMALNAKIDALTHQVALMKAAPVNHAQGNLQEEQQLFEVEAANFAGNQGRQPYNSYNNNYNPNWQPKQEEKKPSFDEIMMKYVAGTEARLQNQESMLQKLEVQMSQIATQLSTRPAGALPSNTEPNPRGVNAIMVVTQAHSVEQHRDEKKTKEGLKSAESKEDTYAENSFTADALAQMPNYARFLKDLLKNQKKLNDVTQVTLNEECSAVLKKKLPPKFQDLGSFSIPCHIGSLSFDNVLYFVILDMDEDFEVHMILGRPFLAASRALVDVEKRELVLRLNDEQVVFNMLKSATESPTLKSCSAVYLVDETHDYDDECLQIQL
ncbi:uncharacterized protein [Henckelia pumila]|uniref:uncharacterized protein n=1 Tax=Henckelia pumila TaxID=405737 RepID=UPI003C6E522E